MSAAVIVDFKDTTFSIPTAYATGKVITGITNASPPVVTSVAHGFTDFDVVKITGVVGMTEVNDRIFVVDVASVDTFTLIGVDATNYDAYTSGGAAAKATMSASCQVTSYAGPTGTTPTQSVVTNCGTAKSFGDTEPGTVTIAYADAPGAFRTALLESWENVADTVIKTVLPKNKGISFDIGVVTSVDKGGQAGGNWTGGATLERRYNRIDIDPS
jgi:hypothetical protein